jgi:hypothetical protein
MEGGGDSAEEFGNDERPEKMRSNACFSVLLKDKTVAKPSGWD